MTNEHCLYPERSWRQKQTRCRQRPSNKRTVAVANNINRWTRSGVTFNRNLDNDFTDQQFVTWEAWFVWQITGCWFQKTSSPPRIAPLQLALFFALALRMASQLTRTKCHQCVLLRLLPLRGHIVDTVWRLSHILHEGKFTLHQSLLQPLAISSWWEAVGCCTGTMPHQQQRIHHNNYQKERYIVLKTTMPHARSHHNAAVVNMLLNQV